MTTPSTNGRDGQGRFVQGNPGGPGNPRAASVGRFRSALLGAVTNEDFAEIARKLVDQSKAGDIAAIKELLNRTLGKPSETEVLERLEQLEQAMQGREND